MALELVKLDSGTLPAIANAIRAKTGDSGLLLPSQMAAAIAGIQAGVTLPALSDPAAVGHVLDGKEYIDGNGAKQTGALVVCDTVNATEGGIGESGIGVNVELESSADGSTKTMTLPEPNLLAENIKNGVSIFGIAGTAISSALPSNIDHIIGGTLTPAEAITTYIDINVDITWTPKILLLWTEDAVTDGSIEAKVAGITILSPGLPYQGDYSVAIVTHKKYIITRMAWGYHVGAYFSSSSVVRLYGTEKNLAAGWKYNWLLIG